MSDFIDDAIIDANVALDAEQSAPGVFHCVLKSDYGQMVRDITLKEGHQDAPATGQLLYHFALVAQGIEACDDFADWAEEYDHDPADAEAKAVYEQYVLDAKDLRALLGGYTFGNLMGGLAIHQAIGNAGS